MQFTWAALATLISISISTAITLFITRKNARSAELNAINNQLNDLLKICIQYPNLEFGKFTEKWDDYRSNLSEEYIRYDNYCTLVYNCLERISGYFEYNEEKIQKFINMKDWVRLHKANWKNPSTPHENSDSYPKQFIELVDSMIR